MSRPKVEFATTLNTNFEYYTEEVQLNFKKI